jgi:hypothetical protein
MSARAADAAEATHRLQALNREAQRAIARLPDRERAMMLMLGSFGSHRRPLVHVARTFGCHPRYVHMVEIKVFEALGTQWHSQWRAAREASWSTSPLPYERHLARARARAFCLHGPARRGRSRAPRRGVHRRRGSRRVTGTSASREDPPGDEPPSQRRSLIGGRR